MTHRESVGWEVDAAEYDRFREWVDGEYGAEKGRLGKALGAAMREWLDEDGYDRVETLIDRLVVAAGRRPSDGAKNKKNGATGRAAATATETETTRIGVRVPADRKERFAAHARGEAEAAPGDLLTDAMRAYRQGGRAARLERKLERVVGDAEAILSEVAADAAASESDGLSPREERTIAICERLRGGGFTEADLLREIDDIAGRGMRASDPTRATYRERVLDRLDYEPHPANPEVWIPREQAKEYAGEAVPTVIRRPVAQLDRDQRLKRIKLALGERAAAGSNPTARAGSGVIRTSVLDDAVSLPTVTAYLEEVAFDRGFELHEQTGTQLAVNLEAVADADPDLAETIETYRESDADALLSAATTTSLGDYTDGTAGGVSAALDRIEAASPAADGGPNGGDTDGQ